MPKKRNVRAEDLPYRPCVGAMVLNTEGRVWVGHRLAEPDGEMATSHQLWQMPQGGIDPGEEPLEAARREIFEETGMESLKLLAETPEWINYDLPPELVGIVWKGKYRGQTQKWFAFRFHGDEREIRIKVEAGNEGKLLLLDIETGDFKIDEDRLAAARRLRAKNPRDRCSRSASVGLTISRRSSRWAS